MTIFSNLSRFNPFFSIFREQEPKRIFKKYQSLPFLFTDNIFDRQRNQEISNQLPTYVLNKARLSQYSDGRLALHHTQSGEQETLFENEEEFQQWFRDEDKTTIWEIKDKRENKFHIFYKAHFGDFKSDQELFENITQKEGRLWKIVDHKNNAKIAYIYARRSWIKNYSFEAKNLENLRHLVSSTAPVQPQPVGSRSKITRKKIIAIACLALIGRHNFSTCAVAAQNMPPLITGQSPLNLTYYSGQPIDLDISSLFTDPNHDTLKFFTDNTTLPPFVTYHSSPSTFVNWFNTHDGKAGLALEGPVIHSFGGTNSSYTLIDLAYNRIVDTSDKMNILTGNTNGNLTVLNVGNGYQTFLVLDQIVLNPLPVIPANLTDLGVDFSLSILWTTNGHLLNARNLTDFEQGHSFGSFSENSPITGLVVGDNQQIYIISTSSGLRIVDGSNPSNPTSLGVLSLTGNPSDLFCQNGICYVTQGSTGWGVYNMTSGPVSIGSFTASNGALYDSIIRQGLVYTTRQDQPTVIEMFDASNLTTIQRYQSLNLNGTVGNIYSVLPDGNHLYIPTNNGTWIYAINQDTLSGIPTPADRGIHTFNISANDFNGGTVNLPVVLNILNYPPVASNTSISLLNGVVGVPFSYLLPNTTFSDRDDPISNLTITLQGLPFASYEAIYRTIQGTPTQAGDFNFTIIATDPYGANASISASLLVNALSTTNSNSGNFLTSGLVSGLTSSSHVTTVLPPVDNGGGSSILPGIVGGVVGGIGVIILVGGIYIIYRRKKKNSSKIENIELASTSSTKPLNNFRLPATAVKKTFTKMFGGNKFAELKWSPEEIHNCYKDTGLIVDPYGVIGKGAYGEVAVCWDIVNSQYAVMKTIENEEKFAASIKEAGLQLAAQGPGIWGIYNYVQDDENNRLVLLFPPAGLTDVNFLSKRIEQKKLQLKRTLYATYLAQDILTGLETLVNAGIYHCDLKEANVLVSQKGKAGISDFGCGIQTKEQRIPSTISDINYKSPEQMDSDTILFGKEDAWAIGLTLLAFLLHRPGWNIVDMHTYQKNKSKTSYTVHIENQLSSIQELKNPVEGSLWCVVKGLLMTDHTKRWSASKALKAKCFENLDVLAKEKLFQELLPDFTPSRIESLSSSPRMMSPEASSDTSALYSLNPNRQPSLPATPIYSINDNSKKDFYRVHLDDAEDKDYVIA